MAFYWKNESKDKVIILCDRCGNLAGEGAKPDAYITMTPSGLQKTITGNTQLKGNLKEHYCEICVANMVKDASIEDTETYKFEWMLVTGPQTYYFADGGAVAKRVRRWLQSTPQPVKQNCKTLHGEREELALTETEKNKLLLESTQASAEPVVETQSTSGKLMFDINALWGFGKKIKRYENQVHEHKLRGKAVITKHVWGKRASFEVEGSKSKLEAFMKKI